jgi:hypothetical protein
MKFNPPILTRGPLSGSIYVVTHGKVLPHPDGEHTIIEASVKYDVTEQYNALKAVDESTEADRQHDREAQEAKAVWFGTTPPSKACRND